MTQPGDPFGIESLLRPDTRYEFVGGPADGQRKLLKSGFLQIEVTESYVGATGGTHVYHVDPHNRSRMLYQGPKRQ